MGGSDVEFALIVERGPLEAQAALLCESIRRFTGRYRDAPISVISPRSSWRPANATLARLQELGITYHELDLTSPVPAYGPSFRVLAMGWLAQQPGPGTIVQLDSDTVFVAEPNLDLGDALALAHPEDEIGMCSKGAGDKRDQHWQAMCRVNNVEADALGWVHTRLEHCRVRATYNAGFVVARRVLFNETAACLERIIVADLRSWPDRGKTEQIGSGEASVAGFSWWGTSQAAIPIAAARLGGRIEELDAGYNVPLHRLEQLGDNLPLRPVHLHYHWHFAEAEKSHALIDLVLPNNPEAREWLHERVPLPLRTVEGTGVFSPEPIDRPQDAGKAPPCSVVMTCYRDTRFLRAAVDSVLAQDFVDFELIVVDDGSPDPEPVALLAGLDSRIKVLRLDQNVGAAEAANRGIALSRAPLIARLDADDIAKPNWLGAVVSVLRDDTQLGLVGSAVMLMDERGRTIGVQSMPESDFAIRFTLLFHCPFYHPTTAFRRSLFDLVGGYRADQLVSMDHYLWAAMLPHCRARNLSEPLVHYRLNSQGLTALGNTCDPQGRTTPIRLAAWREIGMIFPLANRQLGEDASALLRGHRIEDRTRKVLAREVLEQALRWVEAIAPDFLREGEASEAASFAARLRDQLVAAAPAPGLVARTLASVKRQGLMATFAAGSRKFKNRAIGSRSTAQASAR